MTPTERRRRLGHRLLLALPLAALMCFLWPPQSFSAVRATVVSAYDGDTLKARYPDGKVRTIRLVQIDTPELRPGECYGLAARDDLRRMVLGKRVTLMADPELDKVDRFGRLLRYVWVNGTLVQHRLVQHGSAEPWFFDGRRGRYSVLLDRSARAARRAPRGAWRHCPQATYTPTRAWSTGPKASYR